MLSEIDHQHWKEHLCPRNNERNALLYEPVSNVGRKPIEDQNDIGQQSFLEQLGFASILRCRQFSRLCFFYREVEASPVKNGPKKHSRENCRQRSMEAKP